MKTYKEEATGRKLVRALNESRQRERHLAEALQNTVDMLEAFRFGYQQTLWEKEKIAYIKNLLAEKPVPIFHTELVMGKTAGPAKAELMDVELEIAFGPVEYNDRRAESIRFKKVVVFMKGMLTGVLIGLGCVMLLTLLS